MNNKFEKTRILSARALQVNDGAITTVKPKSNKTIDIVKQEFEENKVPLKITRK